MLSHKQMQIVCDIAKTSKMTDTAKNFGLNQTTVTRSIQNIEEIMGIKLTIRSHYGVTLTSEGRSLAVFCERMLQEFDMFKRQLQDEVNEESGDLAIKTTFFLGSEWLAPKLAKFSEMYPNIRLRLEMDTKDIDLPYNDVLIRTYIPDRPNLVQIPILKSSIRLYASSEYIKRNGLPQKISDLDKHKLITFFDNQRTALGNTDWILHVGKNPNEQSRESTITANSFHAMIQLVKAGFGIAQIPDCFDAKNNKFIEILPKIERPIIDIFLIYEKERENVKRIKSLENYLKDQIP